MKNVRLFYKKGGPLRFASHLDMNRFMTRLLRRSGVPVWYTEGFHKHPYITFALPLSLGFSSEYEVMDFRLNEDEFPLPRAQELIEAVCPPGMKILRLADPVNKSGKIAMADFEILFAPDSAVSAESLTAFLQSGNITAMKKNKKGGFKEIDISAKIRSFSVGEKQGSVLLLLRLPAGGEDNLNPCAVADEYLRAIGAEGAFYAVNRVMLYLADGTQFV